MREQGWVRWTRPAWRRFVAGTIAGIVIAANAAAQSPVPMPAPTVRYPQGEDGRVVGPIVMKRGNDVLVRDETTNGTSLVTLQPTTTITRPSGFLNLDRKTYTPSILIPGLTIDVRGTGDKRGHLVADRISFSKRSLETAQQIAAADVELRAEQRRTAASLKATRDSMHAALDRLRDSLTRLQKRLADRPRTVAIKASATVHFAPSSTVLTDAARRTLDQLAAELSELKECRIDVTGFADADGPDDMNETLSRERARAVVDYLERAHGIDSQRFLNPSGAGAAYPVADNDTPAGRAQNRRVEVQVLVEHAQP